MNSTTCTVNYLIRYFIVSNNKSVEIMLTILLGIFIIQCSVLGHRLPEPKVLAGDCTISTEDLPANHPLILKPNTVEDINADPTTNKIVISAGDTIELACAGSTIAGLSKESDDETAIATCVSDNNFEINQKQVSFNTIECSKKPAHVAQYTGATCAKNIKEIEIGFQVDADRFKRTITACFDEAEKNPIYTYYNLTKSIGSVEVNVARPGFVEDDFYNLEKKLNSLYTRATQKTTINQQLGLDASSEKYISTGNFYLAKGHLTAKTDFVYAPQQTATFHYVNTAPQWQNFNSINWFAVENNVRSYASTNEVDLVVYTGDYGKLAFPHAETGEDVELYLYADGDDVDVPVPKLFWKLVYDPSDKSAVVLLGVNNPYAVEVDKDVICTDVSDQLDWLTMDKHKVEAGYIFACSYDELNKVIDNFPKLDVKKLLT